MPGTIDPLALFVSQKNIERYRRLADAQTSDEERTKLLLLLREEREQLKRQNAHRQTAAHSFGRTRSALRRIDDEQTGLLNSKASRAEIDIGFRQFMLAVYN